MDELDEILDGMFGLKKESKPESEEKAPQNDNFLNISADNINFSKLSETSDFKRLIYLAITGESFRGKNSTLERVLNNKLKKLRGK